MAPPVAYGQLVIVSGCIVRANASGVSKLVKVWLAEIGERNPGKLTTTKDHLFDTLCDCLFVEDVSHRARKLDFVSRDLALVDGT